MRIMGMDSEPKLLALDSGDVLELRPAGAWVSANVTKLDLLARGAIDRIKDARKVRIDVAGISKLDTIGAWLIEKLARRAAAQSPAELVGAAEAYSGLMDEVRKVNRQARETTQAPNWIVDKLTDIGRWST